MMACVGLLAPACDNDLDEKVYSSLTESSYNYSKDDLVKVVGAGYKPLRDFLGHQGLYALDVASSDELCMPPNSTGWDDGGIYRRLHYHTWNSEQVHVVNAWSSIYSGALLCNNAINTIESGKVPVSDAEKEAGINELRALRAFYYLYVLDFWGDAPLVTDASSKDLPAKTDRKDIYDFVVSELKEVAPKLSEVQGGLAYGHMNKWAALGYLAKAYLNAEVYTGTPNWQGCADICDEIIRSGKFSLSPDYKDPFRADNTAILSNKEVIFTIPFDRNQAGGNFIHQFSWGAPLKDAFAVETTPWGSGSMCGVPQFVDTYDEEDCRLADSWVMGPQFKYGTTTPVNCIYDYPGEQLDYKNKLKSGDFAMEDEGYRMKKFEMPAGSQSDSDTDFPLLRYAEVLMMKAECLLRLGKSGAGELVTEVRQRAFKANPSKATVTDEQLKSGSAYKYGYYTSDYGKTIDAGDTTPVKFGRLYDEYGWEFAWELGVRTRMIRFGTYTTKSWLSHKPQGDYRSVFPIPNNAITPNPKLEQNPNYK